MPTPWAFIESETYNRLNNLASTSIATADAAYRTIPKTDTQVGDEAFPKTAIREAIVDVILEVISFICSTEGDPRRAQYRLTASVAHGGLLPSGMGPYGAVSFGNRPMVPRAASIVAQRAANPNSMYSVGVYFFAIDGDTFYATQSPCTVEYFNYERPADTYTELDALFDSVTDYAPIPDEFAVNVADGAAGRLAMKAGSFIEAAQAYLNAYYQALASKGLKVTRPDFPAMPAA